MTSTNTLQRLHDNSLIFAQRAVQANDDDDEDDGDDDEAILEVNAHRRRRRCRQVRVLVATVIHVAGKQQKPKNTS